MFRALAALLLLSPLAAAEPDRAKPKEYAGVVYSTVEKDGLKLDLVVPAGPGPHPCVVGFHGGAWTTGDRLLLRKVTSFAPGGKDKSILKLLAENGFAAASVSYRLAPKHPFPAQIIDAKTAVRFLRANAKKYDLDPDRFAALGYSAGGHLASLLGTTDAKAGFDTKEHAEASSAVKCVVNFYGPCDLKGYAGNPGLEDVFLVPVFGKECRTDATVYEKASPIGYASKASAPSLFIHGTSDFIVPFKQTEAMCDKLKGCGVTTELLALKGRTHGWTGDTADQSAAATLKFLKAQLKGEK